MTEAITTAIVTFCMWTAYGVASVILGALNVTGSDRVALSFLAALALLARAGVYMYEHRLKRAP